MGTHRHLAFQLKIYVTSKQSCQVPRVPVTRVTDRIK